MSNWYQQQLTPPDVLELNLRVGVIPSTDHVQALVELKDPVTGIQISQWSVPHRRLDDWLDLLDQAASTARDVLSAALEPF